MITDRDVNVFDFSLELLVNLNIISQGSSQISTLQSQVEVKELPQVEIGHYVEFGMYKGKKITWRVINDENDTLLLFSHKFVDKMPFGGSGDWKDSSVRNFLNDEHQFLEEFSFNDRDMVIEVDNEYVAWHHSNEILK
ncbi:hypothetical protein [Paenibacillus thiaminolyticus]|uniref:hypothetical protein n=1 Tax=Paenibacillus thiaminolyticus TaxID=49283 RepID=UPI002543F929|nr:hypothetical protein [Paenibacillus thiaminolyticus]WII35267.1 hypothetical protein O0V01_16310 [Paenibacillus thiaminolyticus]